MPRPKYIAPFEFAITEARSFNLYERFIASSMNLGASNKSFENFLFWSNDIDLFSVQRWIVNDKSAATCDVNALVEATPISGPALVYSEYLLSLSI